MNLLYATPSYKPAYRAGGPVLSVSAVAERLVHRGHRVSVFTTTANLDRDLDVPCGVPVDVDGVTVRYFKRREPAKRFLPFVPYLAKSAGYLYAPGLRHAIEEAAGAADIVHAHFPVRVSYTRCRAGRAPGPKTAAVPPAGRLRSRTAPFPALEKAALCESDREAHHAAGRRPHRPDRF